MFIVQSNAEKLNVIDALIGNIVFTTKISL